MPTIVTRLGKGSPLTTAELDANLTNINAETVDNSGVFNLRPSLDIDLVGSKSVSPLVSFSRGSTGTYFDSDGLLKTAGVNQPRFDYDPITKELKGLLIEESRTNLQTYSSDFSLNRSWSGTLNTIITAPDGTLTADLCTSSWIDNYPNGYGSGTGTIRTYSVFVKPNTATSITISAPVNTTNAVFNFSSKVLTGSGGFQELSNGWFRVWVTYNVNNPSEYNGISPTGGSVYLWGAQLEAGSTPTSYIPTTSTAVTRSADQLSINKTSNWFNSTNGTLSLSHDAASGQPLLGDGSSTIISSLGAGTVNIDYSNTQLSVVTQSGQSNNTTGIFNFDTDLYIGGNSTSKINNHIKYLKFYPNNVINSTPDGSGLLLDTGFALLQEDGSVIFQE